MLNWPWQSTIQPAQLSPLTATNRSQTGLMNSCFQYQLYFAERPEQVLRRLHLITTALSVTLTADFTSPSIYLPLLSCMFGLAPACRRDCAICAISAITSGECFLGLYDATRCRGVSCSPSVAAFTRAPFLMRKFAANLSPFTKQNKVINGYMYPVHFIL